MGRIYLEKNGKKTVLFNNEDINSLTPETNTYFVGTDLNSGQYEKLNPNGSIINLETGGFATIDTSSFQTLISTSGLTEGLTYKITGVHPTLYGGTDVFVLATSSSTVAKKGFGLFYNPKYDDYPIWDDVDKLGYSVKTGYFEVGESLIGDGGQTGTLATNPGDGSISIHQGTGDWTTATSLTGLTSNSVMTITSAITNTTYSIGDKVIWGGKVWENANGNVGQSTDMFTLDGEWSEVAYNETVYILVTDEIEYDCINDYINFRKDAINEVTFVYELGFPISSIKAFPWGGKVYLCKINNALIYDENLEKRNLLNFLGEVVTVFEVDLLSVVSFDYIGYNVGLANFNIGTTCLIKGLSIGDGNSVEQIHMGNSTSIIDVSIANNDDNYTQGLRNIRLNGGYTADGITFYPNNNSYINKVNILSEAIIDNLELDSSVQNNGSYIYDLNLHEGCTIFNVKLGYSAYFDTLELTNASSLIDLEFGPSTYMSNIFLNLSGLVNGKLNGGSFVDPTILSYIDNLTLINTTFATFDIGLSSYIQNVNLDNTSMGYVTLGSNSFIDGVTGTSSTITNITMESGADGGYGNLNSYISNVTLDTSEIIGLILGQFTKIDSINLTNDSSLSLLELGDYTLLSGLTANSGFISNITTKNNCQLLNITLGDSNFTLVNLESNCQITNVTIGDSCSFDTLMLKTNASISDIVLENSTSSVYIELGIDSEMSNIYMPTGTNLSDIRIGGPLSLIGFTGSSLTNSFGYIIDHDNNNFPAVLDVTGLSTIDLASVYYAGEVRLTSSNPSEGISAIDNLQRFYPVKFIPESGLTVDFNATNASSLSSPNQFLNSVAGVSLIGDNYDYIVVKNIRDNYLQVIESKNNL